MSSGGDAGDAAGGRDGVTVDALLRQRGWLRRLAGSLVVDAAAADDLAQQALLVALEQPPAHATHPRAWLATVVRRLAQRIGLADARRDARERTAAPRESLPAADEVVARAEQQHAVSAALLALPEPYRATLLLRFVDDLPPRAIAKKRGVAVETVRTQLKRGLELLRERLIAAHGGGTKGTLALLGLLDDGMRRIVQRVVMKQAAATAGAATGGSAAAIAAISGALWMSTKLKLVAALVVVAGGSFALVQLTSGPQVPRSDATHEARHDDAGTPTPVDAAEFALPTPVEVAAERAVVPPVREAEEAADPTTNDAPATCVVEGIVVSADGAPVPGALVFFEDGSSGQHRFVSLTAFCGNAEYLRADLVRAATGAAGVRAPIYATCDSEGLFRIERVPATTSANVAALHPEAGLGVVAGFRVDPLHPPAELEIVLKDGIVLIGDVTDSNGQPVAGARLSVTAHEGRDDKRSGWGLCSIIVAADGSYRSLPLPFRDLALDCWADGFEQVWGTSLTIPLDERTHRENFVLQPMRRIEGRIVALDGGPARLREVERALFFCGSNVEPNETIGDARMHGSGELDVLNDRYTCKGNETRWVSLWCDGVMLGRAPVERGGDGPDLVVDLARVPPPAIRAPLRLDVVNADDGKPVALYDLVVSRSRLADLTSSDPGVACTIADEAGRAEVAELRLGTYDVIVRAGGYAPRFLKLQVAVDAAPARVELGRASKSIAGRVIDEQGRPQSGVIVDLYLPDGEVALPHPDFRTRTNQDGAFEFQSLAPGDYIVIAMPALPIPADSPAPAARRVASGRRDAEIVMRQAADVRLRIGFPMGVSPLFQMRVLDERGAPLLDDLKPNAWSRRNGYETPIRLAPGAYSIEIFAPRLHGGPVRFTAADGIDVAIEMTPLEPPR